MNLGPGRPQALWTEGPVQTIDRPLHYGPPLRIPQPFLLQGGGQRGDPPDEASQYDWVGGPEPVPDFFSRAATDRPNSRQLYDDVKILLDRYEFGGRLRMHEQMSDLQRAITLLYELLTLVPYDRDPPAHSIHHALGSALLMRYRHENGGDRVDLTNALFELEKAFASVSPSFSDRAPYYADLGCALRAQSECSPDLALLERAIQLQRCATKSSPGEHSRQWLFLRGLARSLLSRYEITSNLPDLEEAITLRRCAFETMPDRYPNGSQLRCELVAALRCRYERLETLDDVNSIITILRVTLQALPDHGDIHHELSHYLEIRFKRTNSLDDLCALLGTLQGVAEFMGDAHPKKPPALEKLDWYLQIIHQRLGIPMSLEQARSARQHAELSREEVARVHSDRTPLTTMRASELRSFLHLDDLRNKVMKMPQLAVGIVPDDLSEEALAAFQSSGKHPYTSKYYLDVGMIDAARNNAPPSVRFRSAVRCSELLSRYRDSCSIELLLEAHSNMFELIPQVFGLSQSADQRFAATSKVGTPVHEAVHLAIRVGRLSQALEWLESGRFLVWSQIIALRPPLGELFEHDANLAKEFGSVCDQLRRIGHGVHISLASFEDPADTNLDVVAAKRRKLTQMHSNLLYQVRACRGFEDFLFPQTLKALLAEDNRLGTVVFLNVYTQSDALCLTNTGDIVAIELPKLSLKRATQLLSVWSSNLQSCGVRERSTSRAVLPPSKSKGVIILFERVLKRLWDSVVWPILQAIGMSSPSADTNSLPHVTWCVTGPLAQLPLHAAGVYSSDAGPRIYNYAVSSYTPSLSAHVRACRSQKRGSHAMPQNALIITQPSTPGFAPIPKTAVEGACIHEILSEVGVECTALDEAHATVASVKSIMDHSHWVHIACHGFQHRFDPTLSGFALRDGILTLNMLMSVMADNAELAFLSACQTATGDEKLSDESAHLAAGMIAAGFRGVVATMWSIQDADAPVVVEAYYRRLIELKKAGAALEYETGAAYALHDAIKKLRESESVGEGDFIRWVPFVHFGV